MEKTKKLLTKKNGIIALACVLILAVVGTLVGFAGPGSGGSKAAAGQTTVRTVALERKDLSSAVSTTGMVYSTDATNVYSNLTYPVKTVHVAVGDVVSEGDLLAELDTSGLETDIAQKQASLATSQATAQQNLANAQRDLETYQRNTQEGYDSSLLNAESSVTTAQLEVQNAELDVQSAGVDVRTARRNLSNARQGEGDYSEMDATDSQMDALKDTLYNRETSLEKAQSNLEKAQLNLEKAKTSLEAAKVTTGDSVATYEAKVKSAQLSTDQSEQRISMQKLQEDLAKGTVTAPVSGTVTAVNAIEGGSGGGLLFVIQNEQSLKIVTNVKEYDIGSVKVGDRVTIKADATGDQEFQGILSQIAPTSTLTTTGTLASSTDAEYESEVTVTGGQSGLRIGMNTRLSIITEERKDVYSVPYEAVETNPQGQSFVYAAIRQEDGTYQAREVLVEQGLETDLYVEISGDALTDGLHVVKNPQGVQPGDLLDIPEGSAAPGAEAAKDGEAKDNPSRGSGNRPGGGVQFRMG